MVVIEQCPCRDGVDDQEPKRCQEDEEDRAGPRYEVRAPSEAAQKGRIPDPTEDQDVILGGSR